MGRVKLKIKKLEHTGGRTVTYTKRRAGILKKAKELSILCDIDIALLMFSPSGRPTLCLGERSTIDDVIVKFSQLTPQERAKRKLESLEALKKTFKKLDHDVNVQEFLDTSTQTVEELSNQSILLQSQLSEVYNRLRWTLSKNGYWMDPDKITDLEHVKTMEESLEGSLAQLRAHKENMENQLMSLECNSQFQTGMHLPLPVGIEAPSQSISWLPGNERHPLLLHDEAGSLSQMDIGTLGTSLPNYSCYLSKGKQTMLENITGSEGGILGELQPIECLRLELGGQYPCDQRHNLNMMEDKKFTSEEEEVSLSESSINYPHGGFEPPRIGYAPNFLCNWPSTSGTSCSVAMFTEPPYSQHS